MPRPFVLLNLKGRAKFPYLPDRIRGDYQLSMSNHLEKLSRIFAGTGSEFSTLRTHDDLGHGMRKFLGMRGMNK